MLTEDIQRARSGDTLYDDKVRGLHVRCFAGRKSFYLYYRTRQGDQRRPKLGDLGSITLVQARNAARALLEKVAAGEDPSKQWNVDRAEPTVQNLWDRVYKETWGRKPDADWSLEAERLWTKHVKPTFGAKRVTEPTVDEVARWYATMSGTPTQANRVLSVLRRLFKKAERYRWRPVGSNPANLDADDKFRENKRGRFASRDEIAKLGPILEREARNKKNLRSVAFLYLVLYSGSRPSAIARVTWDQLTVVEVEGKRFGVLRFDGKTGAETVYLPPQAMAVLDALPRGAGTVTGLKKLPRGLWERIRQEAGFPDLWARDLRRTFATVGLSSGIDKGVIGELLNHKSAQTTSLYAKLTHDARLEAVAGTADVLERLLGQASAPVHSLGNTPKLVRPEQAEALGDEVVGGRRVVDRLGDDLPEAKKPGLADANVDETTLQPVTAVGGKNSRAA